MLTHFTYEPFLSPETRRTDYRLSFYHQGTPYQAIYHFNGEIEWIGNEPKKTDDIKDQIQALMLFHVYDQ